MLSTLLAVDYFKIPQKLSFYYSLHHSVHFTMNPQCLCSNGIMPTVYHILTPSPTEVFIMSMTIPYLYISLIWPEPSTHKHSLLLTSLLTPSPAEVSPHYFFYYQVNIEFVPYTTVHPLSLSWLILFFWASFLSIKLTLNPSVLPCMYLFAIFYCPTI